MSATVRITRAAGPVLSARSVAVASSATVSPVVAVGDTVKLNAVTMDFGAPATGRVSAATAAPVAANVTCFRPPASLALSVTVTVWPALTLSPDAPPEMAATGATASSTVNDTGVAGVVWPLPSTADAWIWIVEPGMASFATSNAKVAVRLVAAGDTWTVPTSWGLPVCARYASAANPTSSVALTETVTCAPFGNAEAAAGAVIVMAGGWSGVTVIDSAKEMTPRLPEVSVAMAVTAMTSPGLPSVGTAWNAKSKGAVRELPATAPFR